jgi:hypothetical protein
VVALYGTRDGTRRQQRRTRPHLYHSALSAAEEARMSDKDLNSPDERFEVVSKGNTRELMSGDKNRQKPEDIRLKDETTAGQQDDDDDDSDD